MIGLCTHRESVMIESQVVQVFFPCQMSIVRKQNPRFSMRWTALNALCLFALLISLCAGIGSIENIVENLKVCPHPTLHNLCLGASSLLKNTFTKQGHSGHVLLTSSLKSWLWSWSVTKCWHTWMQPYLVIRTTSFARWYPPNLMLLMNYNLAKLFVLCNGCVFQLCCAEQLLPNYNMKHTHLNATLSRSQHCSSCPNTVVCNADIQAFP